MQEKLNELEAAIHALETVTGLVLEGANIGLLPNELEYGIGDLASEGLDGELWLQFKGEKNLYLSWCGKRTDQSRGGWCSQLALSTFLEEVTYITVPTDNPLANAVGSRLTTSSVYGKNGDPLAVRLAFDNITVHLGNFEYGADTTLILGPDFDLHVGIEDFGSLLWASEQA